MTNQIWTATVVSMRRRLRRASSVAAVVAIVAAAIGTPVIAPEPTFGSSSMVAIARADCPPDCGGGPGSGGTPSGPPGGGTEFVPPSMPAMPSYEPGRGQPPLDQNNGISIYNSAAPQPSQAAQPSQASPPNQDGSYTRAANGEQQPINYNNAPNNQQLNNDWQKLSDQLNQPQGQQQDGQADQQDNDVRQRCDVATGPLMNEFATFLQDRREGLSQPSAQPPSSTIALAAPPPTPAQQAFLNSYPQRWDDAIRAAGLTPADCAHEHPGTQDADAIVDLPGNRNQSDYSDCLGKTAQGYIQHSVGVYRNNNPLDPIGIGDVIVVARWNAFTHMIEYYAQVNGAESTDRLKLPSIADGEVRRLNMVMQPTRRGLESLGAATGRIVTISVNLAVCPEVGAVPTEGVDRLREIDNGTWQVSGRPGTQGIASWNNGDGQLPTRVRYQEWDQSVRIPNTSRDEFRIVTGSDGSAYFTGDHYKSFVRIR
ncbi:ribonuclease domain-containing protein [Mycobacteriaceae bacterium NPDC060252]